MRPASSPVAAEHRLHRVLVDARVDRAELFKARLGRRLLLPASSLLAATPASPLAASRPSRPSLFLHPNLPRMHGRSQLLRRRHTTGLLGAIPPLGTEWLRMWLLFEQFIQRIRQHHSALASVLFLLQQLHFCLPLSQPFQSSLLPLSTLQPLIP